MDCAGLYDELLVFAKNSIEQKTRHIYDFINVKHCSAIVMDESIMLSVFMSAHI